MMTDTTQSSSTVDQAKATEVKKKKARKPKIVKAPGSFRLGVQSAAPAQAYGPCAFEVTIATNNAIGSDGEAGQIREFCRGFSQFPQLCAIKGYAIFDSVWKILIGLNTEGNDADDAFLSAMQLKMKDHFETTPVLKLDFGAGNARYRVLNGGTTVEEGHLNFK